MRMRYNIIRALLGAALILLLSVSALAASGSLVPVGATVGIDLRFGGVMVAELTGVSEGEGPAQRAGVVCGDVIVRLGDTEIRSAPDFIEAASRLDGSPVELGIVRGGGELTLTVTPECGEDGVYRLGLWLRDGVSGIGTVTFYDPETGSYGALGHGINDPETGALVPVGDGEVCSSSVEGVIKGGIGAPGELSGQFERGDVLGSIEKNTASGIFGVMKSAPDGEAVEWIPADEVQLGEAVILANITGEEVGEFSVEICRIYNDESDTRDFMLEITDAALIEKTGGIVQGMSGSPILQDGRLVGAVTHVLINDPARGYGISIETMLEAAA